VNLSQNLLKMSAANPDTEIWWRTDWWL